ncbi:insulinase family protein [Erythrobacter sp. SDW2]|uniref:M16 family metallopeptidase n=1 Tax=Erythrobacter sp. SDW2 TaxID=2907154 RepID=UPI001F47472C|nr:M16 family metallopeptidase [Erythrobacter sp. SDW2]UIP08010.1 insulinase family protein [Erythrobacter sp. SDW2]
MRILSRVARPLAFILPLVLVAGTVQAEEAPAPRSEAQQPAEARNAPPPAMPRPASLQGDKEVPWLYKGSNVPVDREWKFGELDNGLRYSVRENGVPPQQVSIRIRIDAGSLHERDEERGYAHLLEHLLFRESKYLGPAQAIPTWQKLGASFGNDTNAMTTPTQTVYQLDLPEASPEKLEESFKLLSGMIREPVLSDANVKAEVPIVLAEKRESGGAAERVADASRATLFAGQRLADRSPIGTEATLNAATGAAVADFHRRWYRPEKTVIAVAGDVDPLVLASLIEKYFGDWKGVGKGAVEPAFGDPRAPRGTKRAKGVVPVGDTAVLVEPDLPRSFRYGIMRPWRPVQDTIVYNEGLLMDGLAMALINRRLESRARAGGSYLYAQVEQEDVSRSSDVTWVSFAPLSEDWQTALADVRGVIADALANPPTQEELDREIAEFEVAFVASVEEAPVAPGAKLADNIVNAVDIRETTASPQTVLDIFRGMAERATPEALLARTQMLFKGDVVRSVYLTPATGEADAATIAAALRAKVEPDASARLAAKTISFEDQPAIGTPGTVAASGGLGILGIEALALDNGVRVQLWPNDAEPGRVAVKVRFGTGYRGFTAETAPYASLGSMALIGSGLADLDQEDLDRISTGRKLGFDFTIGDASFTFDAQTRNEDLADQLYLFAAKLGMPKWDPNPVIRAQAAARLAYESYAASPAGVMTRDLDYLLTAKDPRFATPDPATIAGTTPEGFREVWEPLLKQGPVEVMIYGEFDRDAAIEALKKTFGALPPRDPIPETAAGAVKAFPAPGETTVLTHRGDANQAAAVVAWPTGGGIEDVRTSRQLEVLSRLFSNRLFDSIREKSGASYAPFVTTDWPIDMPQGGTITAMAQVSPDIVPTFFAEADAIAADLAANPPSQDELDRTIEPLRQLLNRASTGNGFWMWQLEGATYDERRVKVVRSLLDDYTVITPAEVQALAQRFLAARPGYRLAIIPEGQELAEGGVPASQGMEANAGR